MTPEELDAGFVRVGLEVEELDTLRRRSTGPLVVGRVVSITELTEFKKPIRFCQVEVGSAEPRGIVCGARNFAEGDLIVVALPGAVLPGGFAIAARKTYGQRLRRHDLLRLGTRYRQRPFRASWCSRRVPPNPAPTPTSSRSR